MYKVDFFQCRGGVLKLFMLARRLTVCDELKSLSKIFMLHVKEVGNGLAIDQRSAPLVINHLV